MYHTRTRLRWIRELSAYDAARNSMKPHRLASTVLLGGGVLLVFGGLTAALGFSPSGITASIAAIVSKERRTNRIVCP